MKTASAVKIIFLIVFLSCGACLVTTAGAANWPQWRGPGGSGVSTETNLPAEWNTNKNIKWKTPIAGRGHSSPVVWGNKVVLTTAIEGDVVPGARAVTHIIDKEEFLLLTSEDGDTFVIKAGPKHEIPGTNSVGEPV